MKEAILQSIRDFPGITAAKLAEATGIDIDDVRSTIYVELQSKRVLSEKVAGPAETKVDGYRMNPAYLGWSAPTAPTPAPTPANDAAPEASPPAASPNLAIGDRREDAAPADGDKPATRASVGLAFLRERGKASSAELKAAMALPKKYAPASFMSTYLKAGVVTRDGDDWLFVREPADKIVIPKFASAKQPAKIAQDAIVASLTIGDLTLIQWQNGKLAISSSTSTIHLNARQVTTLRAFFDLQ